MKRYWENDGAAGDDGNFVMVIDSENGSRPSRFIGKTQQEAADKAMDSYMNLMSEDSRRRESERQNRKPDAPRPIQTAAAPRELTADERFRVATEITDPEKAPEAMRTVFEAMTGFKPEKLGEIINPAQQQQATEYIKGEVDAFLQAHPDYYPDAENRNKDLLLNYLDVNKIGLTRNNLAIAYDALVSRNLLIQRPANEEFEEQEPATPATGPESSRPGPESSPRNVRPRLTSLSTGLRQRDASATPPKPGAAPKVTRAEIDAMPQDVYRQKMTEPAFRRAVDALG